MGVPLRSDAERTVLSCADKIEVGDILLTRSNSFYSSVIQDRQRSQGIFHEDHSRWSHAALYIGQGHFIEKKMLRNWEVLNLAKYLKNQIVLVRRPTFHVSEAEKIAILGIAFTFLRVPYGLEALFGIGWRSTFRTPATRPRLRFFGSMLCHEFVDACYVGGTEAHRPLIPEDRWDEISNEFVPAALSWTPDLVDVDLAT